MITLETDCSQYQILPGENIDDVECDVQAGCSPIVFDYQLEEDLELIGCEVRHTFSAKDVTNNLPVSFQHIQFNEVTSEITINGYSSNADIEVEVSVTLPESSHTDNSFSQDFVITFFGAQEQPEQPILEEQPEDEQEDITNSTQPTNSTNSTVPVFEELPEPDPLKVGQSLSKALPLLRPKLP